MAEQPTLTRLVEVRVLDPQPGLENEASKCLSLPAKEWVPVNTRHVDQDHRFPPSFFSLTIIDDMLLYCYAVVSRRNK